MIGSLAPRYGGPSTVLPEMCGALAERGHEVEVFTTDIDGAGRLDVPLGTPQDAGGFTLTYFRVHAPRSYAASVDLGRALRRRLRTFDVVHVHSLFLFHGAVAGILARRHGVPYVVRPHGTLNDYDRQRHPGRKAVYEWLLERRNLERAAAVHYTSEPERRQAEATGWRLKGVVIPNGVVAARFAGPPGGSELLDRHPELGGKRLVTHLGRITPKKRVDISLDAFAAVAGSHDDAHVVIAGPDENGLGERLRERAVERGLERRVTFTGMIHGAEKIDLLRRSYAFVLPSESENFGVGTIEALAAGVPVVVTAGVALHEAVTEAEAGLVVERSADAVAAALDRLLEEPETARRLGANAGRLARTNYDWRRIAEQLEHLYESVA